MGRLADHYKAGGDPDVYAQSFAPASRLAEATQLRGGRVGAVRPVAGASPLTTRRRPAVTQPEQCPGRVRFRWPIIHSAEDNSVATQITPAAPARGRLTSGGTTLPFCAADMLARCAVWKRSTFTGTVYSASYNLRNRLYTVMGLPLTRRFHFLKS